MPEYSFDELCEKIIRIKEIANSVPIEFQNEVFGRLYNSLDYIPLEQNTVYIETIRKLEDKQGKHITDIADINLVKSNIDKVLLFAYYLESLKEVKVTYEYINACFLMNGFDNPQLRQTLRDIINPNKYGFLQLENNVYSTTDVGKNHLKEKSFFIKK